MGSYLSLWTSLEPLVKTRPAEQVPAHAYNSVFSRVKADIALECGGVLCRFVIVVFSGCLWHVWSEQAQIKCFPFDTCFTTETHYSGRF